MADITNPKLLYAKGFLFLLTGLFASALLLIDDPRWQTAFLLAVAVWAFARFYYFAFYVIEHYIDPGYRFAGLGSFVRYLLRKRPPSVEKEAMPSPNNDPLRPGDHGRYADLAARPNPDGLVVVHIPRLEPMLARAEELKGSPLTPEEAERVRDASPAVAMTEDVARGVGSKAEEAR